MPIRPLATAIVRTLQEAGHIAYFAGGWVRDYLLQHPSDDIDIATSAKVEEVQRLFPKTVPVGIAFGIIIVVEQGHPFEVATFRKESGYLDGRRPTEIQSASPEEDALRRDFTINGMFWDPVKEILFDFVEGQKDLHKGIIRAIGDPHERFLEDRLRMMRAVRYSTRFHFPIDPQTEEAIVAHAGDLFPSVAIERVWQEFKKMAQFAHFDRGLIQLHRLHLLATIFPTLKNVSLEEVRERLKPLSAFPRGAPTILELLPLFPNYSQQEALALCDRLKLSGQEKKSVELFYRAKALLAISVEPVDWAHFYAEDHAFLTLEVRAAFLPTEEQRPFLLEHKEREDQLRRAIVRIRAKDPLVRAEHLIQEGISPGKKMGLLLREAEKIGINHGLETKEEIIHFLKKSTLWHN